MIKKQKTKRLYIPPSMNILEIECEFMLAMSGQGIDTDGNHDFGGRGVNERRGQWGNLWNE